ncbi:hypothetical protein [Mucilaginibacter lacusdianchii]|uniref:hypothetical protein n=1 Tax=Mucilaginibacter lacusdianchii TaxID=2684211 RepID=UPI00131C5CA0|nr:hypothetical protein [Mucilaginibacter sp. JXJ CY 39]
MKNAIAIMGIIFLLTVMTSCSNFQLGWLTMDLGSYLIDFPRGFRLKPERGIDSDVGNFVSKDMTLGYDYGAYSDTLVANTQEYIKQGWWKDAAIMMYLNKLKYPDVDWVETSVLNVRPSVKTDSAFAEGCDYIANCAYRKFRFQLPITIPQEIKDHNVIVDTVDHHYRRLVWPKPGKKGITGVYMRDERETGLIACNTRHG